MSNLKTKEEFIKFFTETRDMFKSFEIFDYMNAAAAFNFSSEGTLSCGNMINYVSCDYLNGLINFTKVIGGYMVRRYTSTHQFCNENNFTYCEDLEEWKKSCDYIDFLKNEPHSNFKMCADDVILLGKIYNNGDDGDFDKNTKNDIYVVFWFDKDVSDCSIAMTSEYESDEDAMNALLVSCMDFIVEENDYMGFENIADDIYDYGAPMENMLCEITKASINGWVKG